MTNGESHSQFILRVLERLLPGQSEAVQALRGQLVETAQDRSARGVLLLGPSGSGKSTIARIIALLRYLSALKLEFAQEWEAKHLEVERPGLLLLHKMDWYEEISLPGLVDALLESELFGIVRGAATGISHDRDGVFAKAHCGHQTLDSPSEAAVVTGGVVFLDEMGDLPQPAQAALLHALSGGEIVPVGAAGNRDKTFSFDGLTIAATWKDPHDSIRDDLRARLQDHVVTVPSLDHRSSDIPALVQAVLDHEKLDSLKRLKKLKASPLAGKFDLEPLQRLADGELEISSGQLSDLLEVRWSEHGELRGLNQVLRALVRTGASVEEVLAARLPSSSARPEAPVELLSRMLGLTPESRGVAALAAAAEHGIRTELVSLLRGDTGLLAELAEHLDQDTATTRRQLRDVVRTRAASAE